MGETLYERKKKTNKQKTNEQLVQRNADTVLNSEYEAIFISLKGI